MIPRVAQVGSSFKGAGLYYLHDKQASTSERVAWTHTQNIPSENAELAFRYMAYTAMNKDRIKYEIGGSKVGRKSHGKPVYSFSLAWHTEQYTPEKSHMMKCAEAALEFLGLKEHEAVFVGHKDTKHPHVHIIANLVHPETGKQMNPYNDYLAFSNWAEEYEKEHGKIYCEQRVINNEKRRGGEKVKYKEPKIDIAPKIQELYQSSEDAMHFQQNLETEGYTLAKGDRRGFVLVDQDGKVHSLSRQLKGQRAADIRDRLADLKDLEAVKKVQEDKLYFMRDQYETEQQKRIVDAAIEEEKKKSTESKSKRPIQKQSNEKQIVHDNKKPQDKPTIPQSFAEELDKKRLEEQKADAKTERKRQELKKAYDRKFYEGKIEQLKKQLDQSRSMKERKSLQDQISSSEQTLANIDMRLKERGFEYNKDIQDLKAIPKKENPTPEASNDEQSELERKREALRKQYGQDNSKDHNQENERDMGL